MAKQFLQMGDQNTADAKQFSQMGDQFLQMGDQNTADVKLLLLGKNGVECEETNPLYLHSEVLIKSKFFEDIISDRWTSEEKQLPIEIKVRTSHCSDTYIKCLELMYSSKRLSFSRVDEALAIIPVAYEIQFNGGISQCMDYFVGFPLTHMQEEKLLGLISSMDLTLWCHDPSLGIYILPHLAARHKASKCKSDCRHLNMLRESLQEVLNCPLYGRGGDGSIYITVEKYIVDTINESPSSDFADICRYVLLKQIMDNIEVIRLCNQDLDHIPLRIERDLRTDHVCFVVSWLVHVIQRCDLDLFETVLKMFCEDADLSGALHFAVARRSPPLVAMIDILDIYIGRFIKAVVNAEIILPASYRVSLVTNWVATLSKLISYTCTQNRFQGPLEKGMIAIAETLSLSEQESIFYIWINFNRRRAIDWWNEKLRHADRSTSSNDSALSDVQE